MKLTKITPVAIIARAFLFSLFYSGAVGEILEKLLMVTF